MCYRLFVEYLITMRLRMAAIIEAIMEVEF